MVVANDQLVTMLTR